MKRIIREGSLPEAQWETPSRHSLRRNQETKTWAECWGQGRKTEPSGCCGVWVGSTKVWRKAGSWRRQPGSTGAGSSAVQWSGQGQTQRSLRRDPTLDASQCPGGEVSKEKNSVAARTSWREGVGRPVRGCYNIQKRKALGPCHGESGKHC